MTQHSFNLSIVHNIPTIFVGKSQTCFIFVQERTPSFVVWWTEEIDFDSNNNLTQRFYGFGNPSTSIPEYESETLFVK